MFERNNHQIRDSKRSFVTTRHFSSDRGKLLQRLRKNTQRRVIHRTPSTFALSTTLISLRQQIGTSLITHASPSLSLKLRDRGSSGDYTSYIHIYTYTPDSLHFALHERAKILSWTPFHTYRKFIPANKSLSVRAEIDSADETKSDFRENKTILRLCGEKRLRSRDAHCVCRFAACVGKKKLRRRHEKTRPRAG